MSGPKGFPPPRHVLYANDIFVFCKGTKRNVDVLFNLFATYSQAFGQHLSLAKCKLYFGNIPPNVLLLLLLNLVF